jgi:lambda family phage minor tail protein L
MTIAIDLQTLEPGAVVELFALDLSSYSQPPLYFHQGVNALAGDVVWQGITYLRFPIQATGFAMSGQGTLPRPALAVANVTGLISSLCAAYGDLVGCTVTRKRTLVRYLDAVNFSGGNPSADPTQSMPDDIYRINQKTSETPEQVVFELAAAWDAIGVQIPRRQFVANACPWRYRGEGCAYAGTAYFDRNNAPVADPALDVCSKRLSSCEARANQRHYGGFPGVGVYRP